MAESSLIEELVSSFRGEMNFSYTQNLVAKNVKEKSRQRVCHTRKV